MIQTKLKTFLLLLGMIALIGLGWFARSISSNSELLTGSALADINPSDSAPDHRSSNRPLPVRVLRLGSLAAPQRVDRYRGVVEPSKTSNLSFRRGGRLAEIRVREGDQVKQGDLLAVLETHDVQATIRGTESRIKEAEAILAEQMAGPRQETIKAAQAVLSERESALELAQITLQREANLLKSQASSQQNFDEAQSALDRTMASVEAAREQLNELLAGTRVEQIDAQKARIDSLKAQLDDLKVQLDDCRLLAPFSGVVAQRFVDEGVIAGPEMSIFKLLQVNPLEARFGVSSSDASRLRVGQEVNLTADSKKAFGTISRIEPELDLTTRTQGIVVSVDPNRIANNDNVSSTLIPGETVSLAFNDSLPANDLFQFNDGTSTAKKTFWVPVQSLSRSVRGLWSIMKLTQTSDQGWIVERHLVQVLEVEGSLSQILGATLSESDSIVSEGIHRLTPGMRVEPLAVSPVLEPTEPARN